MATVNVAIDRGISFQRFPLFAGLSAPDCTRIVTLSQDKLFQRRQTIFTEGGTVRTVFLVTSGFVKSSQFGQNGTEVILRLNGPGELLGATRLCSGADHSETAQTLQTATAISWDVATFNQLSERFPIFRKNITRTLEEHLHELAQRFREVSTEKVAPRLSSQLLRLLKQVGRRVEGNVEIGLSREELAQLTGTTLFTVSRLLCQWEVLGIVSTRREAVMVTNLPALIGLSQGD